METETTLAAGIRAADEESKYDAVCKELLSEKIVLAWILKTCAVEFAEYDVSEIAEKFIEGTPVISAEPVMRNESASKISGMGEVDATITEGTVTYDIYFRAVLPKGEGVVELIVNVEAQGGYNVSYPLVKRGVYYSCRMVSAQYGREFSKGLLHLDLHESGPKTPELHLPLQHGGRVRYWRHARKAGTL